MLRTAIAIGRWLLGLALIAASCSALWDFYGDPIPEQRMKGEEILLRQVWTLAAPVLIAVGISLILPWRRLSAIFGKIRNLD